MSKVLDWFRALRWWWKTLILLPVGLTLFAGLYVLARAVQYSGEEGRAVLYIPASADLACGVFHLAEEWGKVQSSDFWKKIETKMLRDKSTRSLLNEQMQSAGLHTVDQWRDERWVEDHPLYSEERILRGGGRDVMASFRVGSSFQTAKMVVATRVSFGDYLLLPFSGLAGSFIGAESEGVGNYSSLKIQQGKVSYYLVIDGAYVVISNDKDLLREGLKKKGKRPKGTDPFWMTADFERSTELAKWRELFGGFPVGGGCAFMDAGTAKSMTVAGRVSGSSLLLDMHLPGAVAVNTRSDASFVEFAPADASGYVAQASGMQELYDWIRGLIQFDPKATPFEKFVQKQASDIVTEFSQAGFEERFLPYAEAPSVLVLGSELGTESRTYTAAAMFFSSPDPVSAIEGLRDTFKEMLQKFGTFAEEEIEGIRLIYFDRPADPLNLNNYLRPCMVALHDCFFIANNLEFARRIIDVSAFGSDRFLDQPVLFHSLRMMKSAKFSPPGPQDLGGGFLSFSRILQGLRGHLPEIAAQSVPDDAELRKEVEARLRRDGLQRSMEEVDDLVLREREKRIDREVRKSERSLRPLRFIDWFGYGIREEKHGLHFRAMLTLK